MKMNPPIHANIDKRLLHCSYFKGVENFELKLMVAPKKTFFGGKQNFLSLRLSPQTEASVLTILSSPISALTGTLSSFRNNLSDRTCNLVQLFIVKALSNDTALIKRNTFWYRSQLSKYPFKWATSIELILSYHFTSR